MKSTLSVFLVLFAWSFPASAQRGGIPGLTPEQSRALAQMNADLAPLVQSLTTARTAVLAAALSGTSASVSSVRDAELALAMARGAAFEKIQSSAAKLTQGQMPALIANGGGPGRGAARAPNSGTTTGGTPGGSPSMPHANASQGRVLTQMTAELAPQMRALNNARSAVIAASLAIPRDDAAIQVKIDAVAASEVALASARMNAMAKIQATPDKLDAEQLAFLVSTGGSYGTGGFTEPEPYAFNDHRGYISLFDGVSLKGWDGNPKFWRVEGGAIVGESTLANPSGNTYISYPDMIAKDFTLKFEIKVEGDGGSGLQYRSKRGLPWTRPIAANVTANVGPVNLNWMLTGPQADFWPNRVYTGQFYSENTPMGIMAWRGQVVEGAGMGAKRLMGTIGDRVEMAKAVKTNDWNEYTIIARGGTFIQIVNGQLMAVMVDDDPDSSNNQPGIFGIEIEATTKVSVRNIWLKKLN